MGSDVGHIFSIASLHRDHSISYAMVCEKRISDLLFQDRKSYLTYVILPMLSREGCTCTLVVFEFTRQSRQVTSLLS